MVVLNSACEFIGGCDVGSPHQQWLQSDLASYPGVCTLAFCHVPYFVTPRNTSKEEPQLKAIWQTLYSSNVHVIVNGHAHEYQRWARQDASGNADPHGIRQFVVGTGGADLDEPAVTPAGNLEISDDDHAVLKLTFHQNSYD